MVSVMLIISVGFIAVDLIKKCLIKESGKFLYYKATYIVFFAFFSFSPFYPTSITSVKCYEK